MQENLYTPDCIRTHSGLYFNVVEPRPEQIDIKDIAWALSRQCRFGAHLPVFYTVAQHSIEVAHHSAPGHEIDGLLHEGFEGLGGMDLPGTFKKLIPGYIEMEDRIMQAVAGKYGFKWPMHESVKAADKQQLEWEWGNIMLEYGLPETVVLTMDEAYVAFLQYFNTYIKDASLRVAI